jgi:hypothetical protein
MLLKSSDTAIRTSKLNVDNIISSYILYFLSNPFTDWGEGSTKFINSEFSAINVLQFTPSFSS